MKKLNKASVMIFLLLDVFIFHFMLRMSEIRELMKLIVLCQLEI